MKSEADAGRSLVSIVVLTKNGEKYFRSLLDGLYCQSGIDQAEIIVIDSGSSDATLRIAAEYPKVKLVRIPPGDFGHGKTRNLGARLASGEFLVFLPQDATPVGSDWLDNLLQPFESAQVVGVFGRQAARQDASAMEEFFLSRTYHARPEVKSLGEGTSPSLARCFYSTVSGAIRAAAWRRFPFSEDVIMSEDQAWAVDVMRAGLSIAYQPSAEVLHSHRYGVTDVFRRNFDSGYSVRQIFHGATGISLGAVVAGLAEEMVFVLRRGSLADSLKLLPYEAARHAGFWLGLRADRLPLRFNKACSGLKYFWEQRADAGKVRQ